jgi:phospholipid transport system substrate-binding protein
MMLDENGTWMIYDVLIEGVSLVNNYKAQFAEIINSGSYEELVRKLKNKELTKSK